MALIKSTFAQVDVKRGRRALERRLQAGEEVTLTLTVRLQADPRSWNDDGVSTAFSADVLTVAETTGSG